MTGIYRATPLRTNPRQRTVKAVYKTYIDVIHFRKTDTKRLRGREDEDPDDDGVQRQTFTAERVEQLKQLSQTPDVYERLARALGGCGLVMVGMSTHTTSSTYTHLSRTHTHTHTHTHTQLPVSTRMMTSRRAFSCRCLEVRGRTSRTPAGGSSELRSTSSSVETQGPASLSCCRCVSVSLLESQVPAC